MAHASTLNRLERMRKLSADQGTSLFEYLMLVLLCLYGVSAKERKGHMVEAM